MNPIFVDNLFGDINNMQGLPSWIRTAILTTNPQNVTFMDLDGEDDSETGAAKNEKKDIDTTEDTPIAIEGYYPLYKTLSASNAASPTNSSHTHTFNSVVYYMPNGIEEAFHGNYQKSVEKPATTSVTVDSAKESVTESSAEPVKEPIKAVSQETEIKTEQQEDAKKEPSIEPAFLPAPSKLPTGFYSEMVLADQARDTSLFKLLNESSAMGTYLNILREHNNKTSASISSLEKILKEPVPKYRVLQRVPRIVGANSSFQFTMPKGKVDASNVPSTESMMVKFNTVHVPQKLFTESYVVNPIDVEETDPQGKPSVNGRSTIGKVVSTTYAFGDIPVRGNGVKSIGVHLLEGKEEENISPPSFYGGGGSGGGGGYNYGGGYGYILDKNNTTQDTTEKLISMQYHSTFNDVKLTNGGVEIMDKPKAIQRAQETLGMDSKAQLALDLCYYSNKESEFIAPAYHVSGSSTIQSISRNTGRAGSIQVDQSLTFKVPKNLNSLKYYCWIHQSMISDFKLEDSGVVENKKIYVKLNPAPFSRPYYLFSESPKGEPLNDATTPLVLHRDSTYEFQRLDSGHMFNIGSSWRKNDTGMKVTSTSTVGTVDWSETKVVNEKVHMLETYIPASLTHEPILEVGKSKINPPTVTVEDVNIDYYSTGAGDTDYAIGNMPQAKNMLMFKIDLPEIKFDPSSKLATACSHGKVSLPTLTKKYVDLFVDKKIQTKDVEKLSGVTVYITETNKYGFSRTKFFSVDLTKYYTQFEIADTVFSVTQPNDGTDIYNYGIEWAETPLGTTIYARFLDEMDKSAYKQYAFDSTRSREEDFKDKSNGGKDDYYVDNVDVSVYMGHGNGNGFGFVQNVDDTTLSFTDARGGQAWGNRDMEFMALMSCQVLRETASSLSWAERWGGAFNGLHLICGFQTNAGVDGNNMLKFFARNMHARKQTVLDSWINAALDDQDTGREAVVMGPLVDTQDTTTRDYKSMSATTSGMYRAYWNDYTWGINGGPGYDLPRTGVKGWWRIVVTI